MCNLYTYKMSADDMRGLMEHFKLIGSTWSEQIHTRNAPIEEVLPNHSAPVVVVQNGERVVRDDMLWGFPKFNGKYGTNFRHPKAHMWRSWLDKKHRCVVPATAFSEPDENTRKPMIWRWFERPNREPFFFAGIWRPWTGDRGTKTAPNIGDHSLFSIMTTEPNAIVAPIHSDAMPVLLMMPEEVDRWLEGTVAEVLEMQRPAPDDAIVVAPLDRAA